MRYWETYLVSSVSESRKCIQQEFDYAYIIDTKSDVRANPKIAGTTHNIFGIQTGVAVMLLVKKLKRSNAVCQILYTCLDDYWRKEQKLQWFTENPLPQISFEHIQPDKNNNWIDITDNDWDKLLPLKKMFALTSPGVNTARDEWVFDYNKKSLLIKISHFIETYNNLAAKKVTGFPNTIKWSAGLKQHFAKSKLITFDKSLVKDLDYRPYLKLYYYAEKMLSDRLTSNHCEIFGANLDQENTIISISGNGSTKPFSTISSNYLPSFDLLEKTQCLSKYRYDTSNNRIDNITDWAFNQFVKQYGKKGVTKEAIFYYVYATLHNPAYREKYDLNLKREFPRIPFYEDFKQWSNWGKALLDLHINYETVKPFALKETTVKDIKTPKAKLKADKETGKIILDEVTTLSGIPPAAWGYKLGNRSALEWVLDQHKESKPKDPTIAENFNTYKFADYKDHVIDLLKRVTTVSVETMKIIEEMKAAQE